MLFVHQDILCASSQFFKSATKPVWRDLSSQADTIDLSDDKFEIVNAYVHWLYTGKIPIPFPNFEQLVTDFESLAAAYVFGEKVMDVKFKNAVSDSIFVKADMSSNCPSARAMNIIYEGTGERAPARRMMVDFVVNFAHTHEHWNSNIRNYSRDLLVDILRGLVQLQRAPLAALWAEKSAIITRKRFRIGPRSDHPRYSQRQSNLRFYNTGYAACFTTRSSLYATRASSSVVMIDLKQVHRHSIFAHT